MAFDEASGSTTAIEAFDAAVLSCFDRVPRPLPDILRMMATDLEVEPSAELSDHILTVVEHFLARGWLQTIDSAG